jgi:outer membrane protein, multidrug efflux system
MNCLLPTLYVGLLTALLAAGCTRGPRYQAPDVPTPTAWKNARDSAATAPAVASQPQPAAAAEQLPAVAAWWALFNDPDLTTLAQQVLARNYSLQATAARIDEARANVRVANSYRLPLLTLDPQAYRTRLSGLRPLPVAIASDGRSLAVTQTQYYIPVNVSYELDVWGRIRSGVRAAAAEAEATEAARRAAQLLLAADAATYYFGLRGLDVELAVLDTARQARAQNLALTQARLQAGIDNEIAVRRAETELAVVEAALLETRRRRQGFEAALATLVGQPASSFRLLPRPVALAAPPVPPAVPATLLARRPDLRQAERQLAAANARLDAARLARLPTVRLNGFVGSQSAEFRGLTQLDDSYTYYVGGMVSIPVFNGGRNRANQQVVAAQYDALTAEYRQAALVAFQEVETALADVQQTQLQVAAQQRALRAARQAGRLTFERYRAGLASYFEIVDADRQTLDAARLLVQAQASQLTYTVQLVRALGGSWE